VFGEIFEEEMGRESVFRDASKLSPDYVPPALVHRDEEFRQLTRIFKPVIESQMSQRALVTGSVGVGKTALTKKFGMEFEAAAKGRKLNFSYLHINCRKDRTLHAALAKLVQHYNPRWPYHGFGPEKLLEMVVTYLNAHDAYLILTLDELDYFIQLNGPDLLYSLSRAAEESDTPNRISIIAIARDKSFLRSLDTATQSTFMHNVLPLDRYTAPQLSDIMMQRVGEAFKTGAVDPETVELIADIASRWGDARLALELLWHAGMAADGKGKDVVAPEHARQAKAEVYPEVKKEVLRELQPHEKLALLAIARRLRITKRAYAMTGDIEKSYQVVCEEYGEEARQHTQLWEYLKRMEGLGLIDLRPSGIRHRGQSFRISVQEAPVEWLEKEMEKLLEGRKL